MNYCFYFIFSNVFAIPLFSIHFLIRAHIMCGIAAWLLSSGISVDQIEKILNRRGPSACNTSTVGDESIYMTGSVLHIQGEDMRSQPAMDSDGNVLLWNGEVFGGLEYEGSDTDKILAEFQQIIISNENKCDDHDATDSIVTASVVSVMTDVTALLSGIQGPYSFIYYIKALNVLIFGRDPFGRRSLLLGKDITTGQVVGITSVAPSMFLPDIAPTPAPETETERETVSASSDESVGPPSLINAPGATATAPAINAGAIAGAAGEWERRTRYEEVDIRGIYCLHLHLHTVSANNLDNIGDSREQQHQLIQYCPWPADRLRLQRKPIAFRHDDQTSQESKSIQTLTPTIATPSSCSQEHNQQFLEVLLQAVRCRLKVLSLTPQAVASTTANNDQDSNCVAYDVGVLFSGGIDSVVLAILLHLCIAEIEQQWTEKDLQTGAQMETQTKAPNVIKRHNKFAIDLINVSFYNQLADPNSKTLSPDRIAAVVAYGELQKLFPEREWRLVHVDVSDVERLEHTAHIRQLIQPCTTHMDLNIGTAFWFASRGQGTLREHGYTSSEINAIMNSKDESGRPLLRVGEEDAALSVGLTKWSQQRTQGAGVKKPSSKKINCERKHREQQQQRQRSAGREEGTEVEAKAEAEAGVDSDEGDYVTCPQEKCGRIAKPKCIHGMCKRCCLKLQKKQLAEGSEARIETQTCRVHKCNFGQSVSSPLSSSTSASTPVPPMPLINNNSSASGDSDKADVPVESQPDVLTDTVTVVESSTCSITGAVLSEPVGKPYVTTVKVLLIGIGADEQMAGYGRHRSAFVRGAATKDKNSVDNNALLTRQYTELTKELNMDLVRLWERNLGRDDRCISDHGREVWSPYLDENVVQFLQNCHLSEVCNLDLPPGEGDKKILRDVAKHLGLKNTSAFVKRAIQFGTRIAKQTNLEFHGSNRKGSGTTTL